MVQDYSARPVKQPGHGVMAYVEGERAQKKTGIRMALGARQRHVLRLALWQDTRLATPDGSPLPSRDLVWTPNLRHPKK
jgi:hypothetical protein